LAASTPIGECTDAIGKRSFGSSFGNTRSIRNFAHRQPFNFLQDDNFAQALRQLAQRGLQFVKFFARLLRGLLI
jgi:hypothetical protein